MLSYSKVFYSPYLYLYGNLSNGLWISLLIFLWFRVWMVYLYVLISFVSSVASSLFLWVSESLMLSRYYNSSLTMLCDFLEFLPVYSIIEMFVLQLSFSRAYGRYLVPRLSSLQLTISKGCNGCVLCSTACNTALHSTAPMCTATQRLTGITYT